MALKHLCSAHNDITVHQLTNYMGLNINAYFLQLAMIHLAYGPHYVT